MVSLQMLIHKNWNHRLEQIEDIGVFAELKARYRFCGRVYDLNVDAGFDIQSKVFWINFGSTPRAVHGNRKAADI